VFLYYHFRIHMVKFLWAQFDRCFFTTLHRSDTKNLVGGRRGGSAPCWRNRGFSPGTPPAGTPQGRARRTSQRPPRRGSGRKHPRAGGRPEPRWLPANSFARSHLPSWNTLYPQEKFFFQRDFLVHSDDHTTYHKIEVLSRVFPLYFAKL